MSPLRSAAGLLWLGLLGLVACAPEPASSGSLPHEAYVWQRQWTSELAATLQEARGDFAGWRVLALHSDRRGVLQPIAVDLAVLAAARRHITAVLRLDGADLAVDAAGAAAQLVDLVQRWRAAGVDLAGVEIDHDCATARLDGYADLLRSLRTRLPPGLRLSITALPAWLDAPALDAVLAASDEAVLQVHAVRSPAEGLFEAALAESWARAFAARSPHPWRLAVPAYGARIAFDDAGAPLAVDSEAPHRLAAVRQEEVVVTPQAVADLLGRLRRKPPPGLAGVVWFRLPLPGDRRAWSLATVRAVAAGAPLRASFSLRQTPAPGGAVDLAVENRGAVDAPPPGVRVIGTDCRAADALAGYRVSADGAGWHFARVDASVLRAGRQRSIGWVQCGHIDKVELDGNA